MIIGQRHAHSGETLNRRVNRVDGAVADAGVLNRFAIAFAQGFFKQRMARLDEFEHRVRTLSGSDGIMRPLEVAC